MKRFRTNNAVRNLLIVINYNNVSYHVNKRSLPSSIHQTFHASAGNTDLSFPFTVGVKITFVCVLMTAFALMSSWTTSTYPRKEA